MAKVDATRDYYAALGLQPNADVNEINKQYRKLGTTNSPSSPPTRIPILTVLLSRQLSNVIQTAILGKRSNTTPNFRTLNPLRRS